MKSKLLCTIAALCLSSLLGLAQTPSSYFQDALTVKRILIDEVTAESCLACSHAGAIATKFVHENPGSILIAHHGASGFKDPFALPKDDILTYYFNGSKSTSSLPMFAVDRIPLSISMEEAHMTFWDGFLPQTKATDRLALTPEAMIKIEGDYNRAEQKVTLRIKANLPTTAEATALRLLLYVVEDDVKHINQALPGAMDYKHHGLVRDLIGIPIGTRISTTDFPEAAGYTKTIVYDISDAKIAEIEATQSPIVKQRPWNRDNIRFVAALVNYPDPDVTAPDWIQKRYECLKQSRVYNADEVRIADMGKARNAVRVTADKENVKLSGQNYYVEGTNVTLKTNTPTGILCWDVDGAKVDAKADGSCSFAMPAKAITAKAVYDPKNVPTSIHHVSNNADEALAIRINPTTTSISIDGEHTALSIYDLTGRCLLRSRQEVQTIDTSAWAKGYYIVSVQTNHGLVNRKIEIR